MPNAALSQKLKPSPKLAEILGSSQPLSRADAVKELWDYFKERFAPTPIFARYLEKIESPCSK